MDKANLWDMQQKFRWVLLVAGAVLFALPILFPQLGILQWVALIPSLCAILPEVSDPARRLRGLYGMGFVFFFCFYLPNFHWFLYLYPLDFAGMDNLTSVFVVMLAWVGLSAFQAIGAALLFPLLALMTRNKYVARLPLVTPLLFAALWTVWEWFQAHSGWAGVPWARLALGQVDMSVTVQSAAYLGSYFVTFLLVAVNGLLAYLILYPSRKRLCAILACSLFLGNVALGGVRLLSYRNGEDTVKIAAIQGNLSSHDDYALGAVTAAKEVYGKYSREAAAAGADVIVWPETALVVSLDSSPTTRQFVKALAVECGVPIIVGAFTDAEEDGALYNSMVVALPDGTLHDVVYNKQIPVPFGEFVPWRDVIMTVIPPLGEIAMLSDDIPAGEDSVVFELDDAMIGSVICFDSIYEDNTRESVKNGAEVLCVSTNDSWFKDSRGVWMHHAQSQLRAIETGRYVARSAVTGVSSVISPTGEVLSFLPPLEEGYAMSSVTLLNDTTPYSVMGDVLPYLCLAATGLCLAYTLVWMPLSARCRKGKDDSILDAAEDE